MDINQIKELRGDVEMSGAEKKARVDFRFVVSQSNLVAANSLEFLGVQRGSVTIATVLPIPFNTEEKVCKLSAGRVKKEDPKMFVALVCYKGGSPVDVLMLNSALFAKPKKIIKYNKKTEQFLITIKDLGHESMQKYAFGVVIADL